MAYKTRFIIACCILGYIGLSEGCGRSRGGRGGRVVKVDKKPPTLTCPDDIHAIADPLQVNTKVYWVEPMAVDDRDGNIKPDRVGLPPGKLFSEGTTIIRYSARDKSKNTASCSFRITVEVLKCPSWTAQTDGWKWCHVSHEMRRGTSCLFGCYAGHTLEGPRRTKCLDTEEWDTPTQPSCQKLQCDRLYPSYDQTNKVDITCTDDTNYRSICSYNCVTGFSVLPGYSKVRVCGATGNWLGNEPVCLDTSPPVFENCPTIRTGYAERTKTSGRVYWPELRAEDNTGTVWIVQTMGQPSGTELDVGDYDVSYMAYDAANNTAFCHFKVVVKQIRCHTIYPLPYTHVSCPEGRIYGASCNFSCDVGKALNDHPYAYCNTAGTGTIKYGVWSFANHQPYCEVENACPALEPPQNGALACDVWLAGTFCKMYCQEGSAVTSNTNIHRQLLVCGQSGNWVQGTDLPDCMVLIPRLWAIFKFTVEYFFAGDCTSAVNEIKQQFLSAYDNVFQDCEAPDCTPANVEVTCGATDRRKRAVGTSVTVEGSKTSTATSLAGAVIERRELATNLSRANESLKLEIGNETLTVAAIAVSHPIVQCANGSVPDLASMKCMKCIPGYYHNINTGKCERCARGFYQSLSGQSSCNPCPTGQTTQQLGATSGYICTDACEPGQYSDDSTPPCSLCDIGTYSATYGTTSCTSCAGSQTTLKPGSTAMSACQEFDIIFPQLEDNETAVPASVTVNTTTSVTDLRMECWVKCSTCMDLVSIADADNQVVFALQGDVTLEAMINGQSAGSVDNPLSSKKWSHVVVTSSGVVTNVLIDDVVVISAAITPSLTADFSVTLGGNFIGSVSQFHMSSNVDVVSSPDTCFSETQGDVLSWRSFEDSDGTFIKVRSTCDAIDNCDSSPCENNGTCTDEMNGYSCECLEGFTGDTCEVNIDDCLDVPCDNNATCSDEVNGYICLCTDGYKGELCEIKVVDGQWSVWEEFGPCSVTCGNGVHSRERVCSDPEPINGGEPCEGPSVETESCTMEFECVNECGELPTNMSHGSMNCSWINNDTRVCYPFCDDGYEFDSLNFESTAESPIECGNRTAYYWNIRNEDNPDGQLPSCTAIGKAEALDVSGDAAYNDLDPNAADDVSSQVEDRIGAVVMGTQPVVTGKVVYKGVKLNEQVNNQRRRRSSTSLTLTVNLSCTPDTAATYQDCYDLLEVVLQALQQAIDDLALTVTYNGQDYNVNVNTTDYDGTTTCSSGSIPVNYYCVPCGPGSYQVADYCERCPRGTYQDETGQTGCKACTEGFSTVGLHSRTSDKCTVPVDEATVILLAVIIGATLAAVVCVITIIVVAIKCYNRGNNVTHPHYNLHNVRECGKSLENANTHFDSKSFPFQKEATTIFTTRTSTDAGLPEIDMDEISPGIEEKRAL